PFHAILLSDFLVHIQGIRRLSARRRGIWCVSCVLWLRFVFIRVHSWLDNMEKSFKNNGKLKLLVIVGTRPEIIRLSAVITKCRRYFDT
ncbi:hypothetical protein B0D78_12350, partial [Pyramidobacter sp. C12-8]